MSVLPLARPGGLPMMDNGPVHADDLDPPTLRETSINPFDNQDEFRMDDEEFEALVSAGISAAEDYIDSELSPERDLAARYYRGEKFGTEVEGQSAVVMTEVRDAVLAMLPGLMRLFCGPTYPVEFKPSAGTPIEQAEAQTELVRHVIMEDNPGFEIFLAAIKDALIRKTGVFTWWYEERESVTRTPFSGLTEEALTLLKTEHGTDPEPMDGQPGPPGMDDPDMDPSYPMDGPPGAQGAPPGAFQPPAAIPPASLPPDASEGSDDIYDIVIESTEEDKDAATTLDGLEQYEQGPRLLYSGHVTKRTLKKFYKVAAVPPEEFILTPTTSMNLDEFKLVGRRMKKTISELIEIGHDEEEIRELIGGHGSSSGDSTSLDLNQERASRNIQDRVFDNTWSDDDPSLEEVKYCVVYMLADYDNDGIAERRKICTVGDDHKIIYNELYADDLVPFGPICPDPEPHSPFGYSVADQTMDVQEIKSEMMRGVLDSLAQSLVGSTFFEESRVNIDDLLNNDNRKLVRTKGPPGNAVMNVSTTFLGQNALPVLEYVDAVKMRRTGVNPASPSGLDPEALQSTARSGVNALVDASQERVELIARIFAETGVSRMMRGVRNLLLRHQDKPRTLMLMGEQKTYDPATWNANLQTTPNVGSGRGSTVKKLEGLKEIIAMQKEIYQTYGPTNPMVKLSHIQYATSLYIRELGFNDPTRFMTAVTPQMERQITQAAEQAGQKPTPEMLTHQAQMALIQSNARIAEQKDQTARIKLAIEDDQKRDAKEMDYAVAAAKTLGDYGIKIDEQTFRAEMEKQRQLNTDDTASTNMANAAMQDQQKNQALALQAEKMQQTERLQAEKMKQMQAAGQARQQPAGPGGPSTP